MTRRRPLPGARYSSPAGSWSSSPRGILLRRPPSPPVGAYRTLIAVPIGNDGIAFPVALSGAGAGQAFAGPAGVGTSWEPAQAAVYTSVGALDAATASLFVGPLPLPQYQVAALLAGGGSQVALGGVTLVPGWFVWAVWAGGTPGSTAYLYVTGLKRALVI